MRKPDFCLCENKGADQLCSNWTTDQCLCVRYSDSTISLLLIAKISSLLPASVTLQANLCRTWSETLKIDFLVLWLVSSIILNFAFSPGLSHVDATVGALVEVIHAFTVSDLENVALACKHYTKLLMAQVSIRTK